MTETQYCNITYKRCYTQKEAAYMINRYKDRGLRHRAKDIPKRFYKCQFCKCYHLTHLKKRNTCKSTLKRYGAI